MGIFSKQGPYQEFKPLFVKEFDADKTVDRFNEAEKETRLAATALKATEALERETGIQNSVLQKHQQKLKNIMDDPNTSIFTKRNATVAAATDYTNDPERIALAKSEEIRQLSNKENANKTDNTIAEKVAILEHADKGGTYILPNGASNIFKGYTAPSNIDTGEVANKTGTSANADGYTYMDDPKAGPAGYYKLTSHGYEELKDDKVRGFATKIITNDPNLKEHHRLTAYKELLPEAQAQIMAKNPNISSHDAELEAYRMLNVKGKDGLSEVERRTNVKINQDIEATVGKFSFKKSHDTYNLQGDPAYVAGGNNTDTQLPVDAVTIPAETTQTEGVANYDVDGNTTDEKYKEHNKHLKALNNAKIALSKNVKVKSVMPDLEKYLTLTGEEAKTVAFEKIRKSLFDKIVGVTKQPNAKTQPNAYQIYNNKVAIYNKALQDVSTFVNENKQIDDNGYLKETKRIKEVLKTNLGYNDASLATHAQLKAAIKTANRNANNITNTLIVPSSEANTNTTNSIIQTFSENSKVSSVAGAEDADVNTVLDNGEYEEVLAGDKRKKIENVADLKKAMRNKQAVVSGLVLVTNKKRTAVNPKINIDVNGKPLYINPSEQLIGDLTPYCNLEIQRHNPEIAKNAPYETILGDKGYIKVKMKFQNGTAKLIDINGNYIEGGEGILSRSQQKVLKSHSTFYAAESPSDPVTVKKEYKIGG